MEKDREIIIIGSDDELNNIKKSKINELLIEKEEILNPKEIITEE